MVLPIQLMPTLYPFNGERGMSDSVVMVVGWRGELLFVVWGLYEVRHGW